MSLDEEIRAELIRLANDRGECDLLFGREWAESHTPAERRQRLDAFYANPFDAPPTRARADVLYRNAVKLLDEDASRWIRAGDA